MGSALKKLVVSDSFTIEDRLEFLNLRKLPAVITALAGESLVNLLAAERETLGAIQRQYGAILFRGFALKSAEDFQTAAAKWFENDLRSYVGGATPRGQVMAGVYESTQIAAHLRIPQHNEMSYLKTPPRQVIFFCETKPQDGGETPLADARSIYKKIPAPTRDVFEKLGVCYHRSMYGFRQNALYAPLNRKLKLRRSWIEAFSTQDRSEVERICLEHGGTIHWNVDDSLRIECCLPAVRKHPATGEKLWFNQANFLATPNSAGLLRWLLFRLAYLDPMRRPFHVTFGNGAQISRSQLDIINKVIENETVKFRWQRGDFLLLDNFLVTHGRMPFRGQRRILVAML